MCSSRKYPKKYRRGGDLLPKFGSKYRKALGTLTRARTDFWIQNLRLFQT